MSKSGPFMNVRWIVGVFAGTVCITQPLHASDDSVLIGKWKLVNFADRLPPGCASAYAEYRRNGTAVAVSGKNITTSRYGTVAFRKGYLIEQTLLSDNGKPNCQGLSSKFVEEHTPLRTYVEVSQSMMRVFIIDSYDQPLLTYERETIRKSPKK
jgi:hypothetical protein